MNSNWIFVGLQVDQKLKQKSPLENKTANEMTCPAVFPLRIWIMVVDVNKHELFECHSANLSSVSVDPIYIHTRGSCDRLFGARKIICFVKKEAICACVCCLFFVCASGELKGGGRCVELFSCRRRRSPEGGVQQGRLLLSSKVIQAKAVQPYRAPRVLTICACLLEAREPYRARRTQADEPNNN